MEPMASGLIGEMNRLDLEVNRKRTRDVLVATLVSALRADERGGDES
jgi:hypothetical protein